MTNKGKFFVIDGVDGSGKGTQTRLVIQRLKNDGFNVMEADFPQYGQKSAALVEEYLNGKFGGFDEVNAYQASIFYACDRFAASKNMKAHLEKGGIIISNRYVTSNKIHQSSKISDEIELNKFLSWLDDLEYGIFKIPKPNKVIFLNMPYEIGQKLVEKKEKEERSYIEGGKNRDIHEDSLDHLKLAYDRACFLVEKYDNWIEIICARGDEIRTIEDINDEVYNLIKKELSN
jgi:dTMP kinase